MSKISEEEYLLVNEKNIEFFSRKALATVSLVIFLWFLIWIALLCMNKISDNTIENFDYTVFFCHSYFAHWAENPLRPQLIP